MSGLLYCPIITHSDSGYICDNNHKYLCNELFGDLFCFKSIIFHSMLSSQFN